MIALYDILHVLFNLLCCVAITVCDPYKMAILEKNERRVPMSVVPASNSSPFTSNPVITNMVLILCVH